MNDPAPKRHGSILPLGVALVTLALLAASSFLPDTRLWGINHLAFYPPGIRIAALALIAVMFVPAVARRVYSLLLSVSRGLRRGGQAVETGLLITVVGSAVLFTALSTATNLLGDGQLIADKFHRALEDPVQAEFLTGDWISPGTNVLYYGAARLAAARGATAVSGIRYLNCLLGMVFVYLFLGLLRRDALADDQRLWLLVLVLFSGAMQLFFGYIELYTAHLLALSLYAATALLTLHGRMGLWVPVASLLVAIALHVQSVVFVPSLFYVILRRKPAAYRVLLVLAPAAAVATAFTPLRSYLVPLRTNDGVPGLVSLTHWVDIANELLLLVPALPVIAAAWWVRRRADRGATAWFRERSEWRFAILALVPCLVYLVAFQPAIGMVRDWDLFAMTTVALVPLALLVLAGRSAAAFAAPAVAITVVMTTAWVGINASASRSLARFESMFAYDRVHEPYARENLATAYYLRGDLASAIAQMERAAAVSANPRQHLGLALYRDENGDAAGAKETLVGILQRRPAYADARRVLVDILAREGMNDELESIAREGTRHHPEQAVYWFYLGLAATANGRTEEGVAALRRAIAQRLPPDMEARARTILDLHGE